MKTITIIVEDGEVQEVLNLPEDLMVVVRDYDVPKHHDHPSVFQKDEQGDRYDQILFTKIVPMRLAKSHKSRVNK